MKSRLVAARVNGKDVKLSRIIKAGDVLELSWLPAADENLEAEEIPLDILYEDKRVVVVNKPRGMVVHPGAGNYRGTLANALLYRRTMLRALPAGGGYGARTGIVHRLDKDTSGVIIAAYDDEALAFLSEQFKSRSIKKLYLALVRGTPQAPSGRIAERIFRDPRDRKKFTTPLLLGARRGSGKEQRTPEPGRSALTVYRVLKSWGAYALLLVRPKTGRTHQIRVHLKCLGTPILGDPLYGQGDPRFKDPGLMLHARSLTLTLPEGNLVRFTAPVPEHMKGIIRCLNRK
jgi:23S rRNA pseudouridine1911/1915/1917 synthase